MFVDNETVIKDMLKLVALSELLQEHFYEILPNYSVSAIYLLLFTVIIHYTVFQTPVIFFSNFNNPGSILTIFGT